jgi:hypothetical protein
MSDPSPPEKEKPPGDANQPGRQKTETLYLKGSQRLQAQEDIRRYEQEEDILLEKSRSFPQLCHGLFLAAVRIWSERTRLADRLLPLRFRRWRG